MTDGLLTVNDRAWIHERVHALISASLGTADRQDLMQPLLQSMFIDMAALKDRLYKPDGLVVFECIIGAFLAYATQGVSWLSLTLAEEQKHGLYPANLPTSRSEILAVMRHLVDASPEQRTEMLRLMGATT